MAIVAAHRLRNSERAGFYCRQQTRIARFRRKIRSMPLSRMKIACWLLLKVFMSRSPGQRFSATETVNGFPVTVTGDDNGQAIVIHPSDHELLLVGYRSSVSFTDPTFLWPRLKQVRVQKVSWAGDHWNNDGEPYYGVDQAKKTLDMELNDPQAILVSW